MQDEDKLGFVHGNTHDITYHKALVQQPRFEGSGRFVKEARGSMTRSFVIHMLMSSSTTTTTTTTSSSNSTNPLPCADTMP